MFGLRFRKQIQTGPGLKTNVSLSGISESIKLNDRITYNTREGLTIRLGNGWTFRPGKLL